MHRVLGLMLALALGWADERIGGWDRAPLESGPYQGESVRYRVVEGMAVAEGDMILGPVDEVRRGRFAAGPAKGRSGLAVINPALRWPDNRVLYVVDPGLVNQARVTQAIQEWEEKTPFRFVERTTETDFVRFRRVGSGCSASLGRVRGEQVVNLADACSLGNTIHEIGHAVGFYHTQSRRDRHTYVAANYANIDKRAWDQYDSQLRGFEIGSYDYQSIMHYSRSGFSRNSQPAMETVPPGIPLGQRSVLSSGDIVAAYRIADQAFPGYIVDTIPSGLSVLVDGESITTPRVFANWQPGQEHTIEAPELASASPRERYRFVRWAHGGERQQTVLLKDSSRLLTAHHAQEILVTVSANAPGSSVRIEPPSADGFYRAGTSLQFIAEPGEGLTFVNWTAAPGGSIDNFRNGLGQAQNPSRITALMVGLAYQANFSRNPVTTVATDPPGVNITVNGVTNLGPRGFSFTAGQVQTLSAAETVVQGNDTIRYRFEGWTLNGEPLPGRVLSWTALPENSTLIARFSSEHLVSFDTDWVVVLGTQRPSLSNVEINPSRADGFYPAGTILNLRSTSADTFRFTHWTSDFTGQAAEQQIEVNDQVYAVANFVSPAFVNARSVVSASSLQANFGLSPGELVWIQAPDIGTDEAANAEPAQGVWPEQWRGVRVLFDGRPGAIVRVERDRVLLAAPVELPLGTLLPVIVERDGTRRGTPQLGTVSANPAVETLNGSGLGAAGRVAPGGTLTVRFTGAGLTEPATPARQAAAGPPAAPVSVRLGGIELPATVRPVTDRPNTFTLEARIPDSLPLGPQPLLVAVGDRGSQPGVFVTIE